MHPLEKKITALVQREKLLTADTTVILAVSGGPDSMAMLHLLAACRRELPCSLLAAYIDHGLRPVREVEEEKHLVAQQASLLGIATHFGKAAVKEHARSHKRSIEDAARRLRYTILQEIAEREGAIGIAVAHTADDQAEEVLLRLIRGTGRKGLSGMLLHRDNFIIRPLLHTPKKELLAYLRDRKIPFAEDSTNANPKYLRNRIRHHLLPLLETDYNPNIRQVLRHTASILEEEEKYFEEHAAAAFEECRVDAGPDKTQLTASLLSRQHPAIQRRIIEKLLCSLSVNPSFVSIEDIRRLAQGHDLGKELHLSRGLRVRCSKDRLFFEFPKGRTPWRGSTTATKDAGGGWHYLIRQPGTVAIEEIGRVLTLTMTEVPSPETLQTGKDDFLDLACVSFPITCRSLERGDRFHPLGAPGSKKVADYLRDRKIPGKERRHIPVLESNGKIIALPGLNIAHNCRVRQATVAVLRISLR